MKKNNLIVTLIFIAFIYFPGIIYWTFYDKFDHTNYENRTLYEKPNIELSTIDKYPSNYNNYYNDHIPFKNEIVNLRSKILYKINVSGNDRVIIGKNGWLFYNSAAANDGDSIADYQKTSSFTDNELKNIKNQLNNVNSFLSKKGIDFYLFIPPNKETVYSDYLDNLIKIDYNKSSKTDGLINYLKSSTNLKIIDPKKELINKRSISETYLKYDTHWNNYGAYIGVSSLVEKIEKDFKSPSVSISKIGSQGDLALMNSIPNYVSIEPQINGFYENITYVCDDDYEFKHCKSDSALY